MTNAASLTPRRRENNNSNNVSSFFHLSARAVKGSFFSVNELFGLIFAKAKSSVRKISVLDSILMQDLVAL